MRLSIDVSGIPKNSPAILEKFIKPSFLRLLDLATVEFLNEKLKELNKKGVLYIEHRKCNFDVEIGRDMLIDYDRNKIQDFVLWSGDSDFADPVNQLQKDGKKVVIFATARRVAPELGKTGAQIYEIRKIKEFLCWPREIDKEIKKRL